MKVHESARIRNVGLVGHAGAGKTSLVEAILYDRKAVERLGSVAAGNTVSDYDPEEIRRGHSISASLIPVEDKDVKINFLDIPGRRDFVGEIRNCIRVSDALVFVLDATQGVETGTDFAWRYSDELGIVARAAFVNKLDKERADFRKVVADLAAAYPTRPVPATLPIGAEADFKGVIDLIHMKAVYEEDRKTRVEEIPAELLDEAKAARAILVEAAAEGDEELMTKFLDDQPLEEDEICRGIREAMDEGRLMPVFAGSATALQGIEALLRIVRECFPSPLDGPGLEFRNGDSAETARMKVAPEGKPALFVFKTVSDPYAGHLSFFKVVRGALAGDHALNNVSQSKTERFGHLLTVCGKKATTVESLAPGDLGAVAKLVATRTNDTIVDGDDSIRFVPTPRPKPTVRMAVVPKGKADEDKIGLGFHKLIEQDPTLHLHRDPEVHQTILEGMGDVHLDVAVHHLKETAHVEVELVVPRVPYRETITRVAEGQGKYKKQSGGRGQYGDCRIRFEPLPEGSGFQFEWAVVGGAIPTKYAPAVEKGLIEAMERGVLTGHKTVDVKAVCLDGSHHAVDSSEMAFKVAASLAFKSVIPQAGPVVLEPILKATITVPERYLGDLMGDMSGRRGRIVGTVAEGDRQRVEALVPMAEMFSYSRDMRSMTQGAGVFETEFDHYARVPPEIQERIVAENAHRTREEE